MEMEIQIKKWKKLRSDHKIMRSQLRTRFQLPFQIVQAKTIVFQ